jgi:hypothetical protein
LTPDKPQLECNIFHISRIGHFSRQRFANKLAFLFPEYFEPSVNLLPIYLFTANPLDLGAVIKKRLPLELPLYTFLQILSVTAFERVPLNQLLTETDAHESMADAGNQLFLFNL